MGPSGNLGIGGLSRTPGIGLAESGETVADRVTSDVLPEDKDKMAEVLSRELSDGSLAYRPDDLERAARLAATVVQSSGLKMLDA